jgi:hypothetical protein
MWSGQSGHLVIERCPHNKKFMSLNLLINLMKKPSCALYRVITTVNVMIAALVGMPLPVSKILGESFNS